MKTAHHPHFKSGNEDSVLKNTLHYLLIVLFYVGLFFLVSFFSQAMPDQITSAQTVKEVNP
ncbi:MAG: hypothetical protein ACKOQ6_05820 [Bacteroidota bacterium]